MNLLKKEFKLSWLKLVLIIITTIFVSNLFIVIKNNTTSWIVSTNSSFEEQYNTAKKWWNQLDICTMSKIVKTSYLQANDDKNYKKWMEIEKIECDKLIK